MAHDIKSNMSKLSKLAADYEATGRTFRHARRHGTEAEHKAAKAAHIAASKALDEALAQESPVRDPMLGPVDIGELADW